MIKNTPFGVLLIHKVMRSVASEYAMVLQILCLKIEALNTHSVIT